ncbi:hypothetical protein CEP54_010569 [Fusarium duplospermum]|uniref:Uncharacterized protein n=1 Tax=Fusarium duplospermum TaxID=1325734 RepID=A0A428PJD2_9HYPO|nr:hypothetical protein CEP54_010569 [Fusarium duplospermum]
MYSRDPYRRRKSPPPPPSRSPSLPSWYHRILEYPEHTVWWEDFDEDISELSESDSETKPSDSCDDEGCELGSDCDKDESEDHYEIDRTGCSDSDWTDVDERDETRSNPGREYDYYYELKKQREERKQQIKQEKKDGEPTDKEKTRQIEQKMEKQVKEAYRRVKNRRGYRDNLNLRGKRFWLGSLDHWQYAYLGFTVQFMTKYVDFDDYPEVYYDGWSMHPPPAQMAELEGQVGMHEKSACYFGGSEPPARPGLKDYVFQSGEHSLTFQFIDNHHLIMKLPREIVFGCHPRKMPPNTPEILTFYGIEDGWEGKKSK